MSGSIRFERLAERLRSILRLVPGGMAVGRVALRWLDPERRAIHLLRKRRDIAVFQPFPTTGDNRYPDLFNMLALKLARMEQPRILSFGCASGAEVRALRARMPHADITGIDVNAHMITLARKADPLSRYVLADAPDPAERYDAVLALAVFRHGGLGEARPEDCSGFLSFADVEKAIARLDAVLEPGGWLAIGNAHFRFADMGVAAHYNPDPGDYGLPPQELNYGRDNKRIDGEPYRPVLFRKKS